MRTRTKSFGRGRKRSNWRKKSWQLLGRMMLKLLIVVPYITKFVDAVIEIAKWFKH